MDKHQIGPRVVAAPRSQLAMVNLAGGAEGLAAEWAATELLRCQLKAQLVPARSRAGQIALLLRHQATPISRRAAAAC